LVGRRTDAADGWKGRPQLTPAPNERWGRTANGDPLIRVTNLNAIRSELSRAPKA